MAKKKKLKKRKLLDAAAASNVSNIMAAVNTVKSHHAAEQQTAVAPQMPAPVSAIVTTPNAPVPAVDLDSWDEDEDEDEGEEVSLTDSNVAETTITIQHAAPAEEIQTGDQQQIVEDRNIESPTEVSKENESMMVVNHPATAPATAQQSIPQSAPAVTEHTNLVPESAMESMQQAAASVPPAPVAANPNPAEAAPQQTAAEKAAAAFHSLSLTVMFTLDLTNFDYMVGLKKPLSRIALDGQEYNLYSPFRKAGKKAETNPAAEGIVRYALANTLDITDAVNNSRVMVVGGTEDAQAHINAAIAQTRKQVKNLFPAKPKTVVASFIDEENRQTIQLQMSDIVNVRSWTNTSTGSEEDGELIATHNAVLNFVVNAGMLYDSDERKNYIDQIEKILLMIAEKREAANTAMVISIAIDSTTLADPSIRELFGALLDEGYALYSRREMHRLEENDFLPQTVEEIDSQLLTEKADLILVRMVGDESEEDEEGDGEEGGAEAATEGAGVE